jgi:hypothetical protein
VRGRFGLPGFTKQRVALVAGRQFFRLRLKTPNFLIEAFRESQDIFETASLHGASPFHWRSHHR